MEQAIKAYDRITASPEFREIERLRERARNNEAQALYHAEQKGRQKGIQEGIQRGKQEGRQEGILEGIQKGISERNIEIARNLMKLGLPFSQITAATGLTQTELEHLDKTM